MELKNNMLWVNFLHLYQPVNTDAHIIKEATEMSYKRVIKALEKNPHINFTFNINGSLILRWEELGYLDLLERINQLRLKGQLDITGTACYHPLLPLIPIDEAEKQIVENQELLKKYFGQDFKPKGFFMPEMAYSKEIAQLVRSLGFEWIILDEIAHSGKLGDVDCSQVHHDKETGLDIIYRSRNLSSDYIPRTIKKAIGEDKVIVTATDGELYGLRHIDHSGEFEKLIENKDLETKTVSNYIKSRESRVASTPFSCSWESTEEELKNNEPYALWYRKDNEIQSKLWELARLSYKTNQKYQKDENSHWSRWHMVRGFASCTFWWASDKDFSHIFGPHAWNPDEIERGMNEFVRSIRAIEDVTSRYTKLKAEKLFIDLKKMIWEKHWSQHWKK